MVKSDWSKTVNPATLKGKKLSELTERESASIGLTKYSDANSKYIQKAGGTEICTLVSTLGLVDNRTDEKKRKGLL